MTPAVLIGEAQPELRQRYAAYLREQGYEVWAAADASELLSMAKAHRPGAIVLDPEIDEGQGLCAVLALLDAGLRVSVIFNTSRPRSLETDFSSWVADAYTVRTPDIQHWGESVLAHLENAKQRLPGFSPA